MGRKDLSLYNIPMFLEILVEILLICELNFKLSSKTQPKNSTEERRSRATPFIDTFPTLIGGDALEKNK